MSGSGEFVSVFRKSGRPILPPVMTPIRRAEMQEYKLKALAVEKKLVEKKMMKERAKNMGNAAVFEKFTESECLNSENFNAGCKSNDCERSNVNEEDKENNFSQLVDTSVCVTNSLKCLSTKKLFHLSKSGVENYPKLPKGVVLAAQDDNPIDEACSVIPTDSSDLQQYLDTTLDDISPEFGSNIDPMENNPVVENNLNEQGINRLNALLALESKLASVKFSPVVDLSKDIPRLISKEIPEFPSNPMEESSSDIVSVKSSKNEDAKIDCTDESCPKSSSIPYTEEFSLPDDVPSEKSFTSCSEMKVVSSNSDNISSKSSPLLVRRGSYTLESPSPTLLAIIHKYNVDDLPKRGTHPEAILVAGYEGEAKENNISEVVTDNLKATKKSNKHHLESRMKSKTSQSGNGQSVFERLAADAARKVEAKRKSTKENDFKIPEVKKGSRSKKGLRSAVSVSNIRTSANEVYKKRSALSTARHFTSDVNISYAVVKANSIKSNPTATTVSLRKPGFVDSSEAPSHLQKSSLQNVIAAQKRKRRRWCGRWEEWAKLIEPINASSKQVCDECEMVPVGLEFPGISDTLRELSPKMCINKFGTENNPLRAAEVEESDSHRTYITNIEEVVGNADEKNPKTELVNGNGEEKDLSKTEIVNEDVDKERLENKLTLTSLISQTDNIPEKSIKDCDNLIITKNSSTVLPYPNEISEIEENKLPVCGENEKSLNDSFIESTEMNGAMKISEETILRNDIPEAHEQVISSPEELLESNSITEVAVDSNESCDLTLKISPERNLMTVIDSPKIPLELERTIESLPETPVGQHNAKEIALSILSRVIEEQDKAMYNLLVENRKREENIRKKFQEQLKYLKGKLTHLVKAMPSPQVKDVTDLQNISKKIKSESISISNNEKEECTISPTSVTRDKLTPQANTRSEKSESTQIFFNCNRAKSDDITLTLPELELSESISHGIFMNVKSNAEVHNGSTMTKDKQDNAMKNTSDKKSSDSVTCKNDNEPKSFNYNLGEITCHSSEQKDLLKRITITSNKEKSCTMDYGDFREEDVIKIPQDLKQKINQSLLNKEYYDLNTEVTFHDLKSSTAIEGCKMHNVDLDLSGILEMEFQGKIISHSPDQLVSSNHENSSSSLTVSDSKVQMNYGFLIEELAMRRKKYEEDALRLDVAESTPRCKSEASSSSETSITPVSARINGVEEVHIFTKSPTEQVAKSNYHSCIRSELPDLKTDLLALQTYLGVETPSTGPVSLGTPISTPACLLEGSSQNEEENQHTASISSKVNQYQTGELNLVRSKSLKPDISSLKTNRNKNQVVDEVCDPDVLMPSIPTSLGRASDSLTTAKYSTPESSSSSVNYMSAMSGSLASHSLCDDLKQDSEKQKGFGKLSALVKGYLTRRLLKTARILGIKATILDSVETALKLQSEVSEEMDVVAADILLHSRILAQLSAAYNELHHIFFELPIKEQMAIISNDRQRLLSRNTTPTTFYPLTAPSPRPALLSAVTLKTLQRRFGNEISDEKDAPKVPSEKNLKENSAVKNNTKLVFKKPGDIGNFERPTRTKSFTSSARQSVKKPSEVNKNVVAQLTGNRKTLCGKVKLKSHLKKSRRSSSAGEMNRRPWR